MLNIDACTRNRACSVIKRSRGGTRCIYHGAASTLLDALLGILDAAGYLGSIDRSIGGNNVASRHGCVPRVERGGSKMKNRRGKRKRVRGRPPLLQRSIIQPALRVSLYTHISVFPAFFRFFFIFDQLLLRPITTGNFQP